MDRFVHIEIIYYFCLYYALFLSQTMSFEACVI